MEWLLKLAPTVASALLGPLGGIAVSAIGDILGISDATQDTIKQAITSGQLTPEQLGRIKELELQYKAEEAERGFKYADLEFKREELVMKDRDSARSMQVSTHSKMPATITILVTLGFFGILLTLLLVPEIKTNEVVFVMVGQLSAVWGACIAFYVSTTYASNAKNKIIADMQPVK